MRLAVNRNAPTSLTDQLKAQIRHMILAGRLPTGTRLPPVRTLAGFLRVNRNTVARAYSELETEGVLDGRPGRGTRVVWTPPSPRASQSLAGQIDRLLGAASRLGIDIEDLMAMMAVRAGSRRGLMRPRLGFVECNPVDLAYFGRLVKASVDVPVTMILLDDVAPSRDGDVDLLVTTFFHAEDVRRRGGGTEVVGLMALPDFQTLEEVSRLPRTSRVALVCATAEGVRSKARSLEAVGLRTPRLLTATIDDTDALRQVVGHADVVLAAPRVLDRIRDAIPAGARVIPFASVLSDGAVALLHERIAAWRVRQMQRMKGRQMRASA